MPTVDEQIKETEDLLAKTKRNKATEHYIGTMMAKLSKLKALKEHKESSGGGKKGPSYAVKKKGDATVVLVGFPSVGKSTLLNALTSAKSKVAAYEFTTLNAIPGMLNYKGAEIQFVDVPGIIEDAAGGKGRGREVISVVRNAELILILLDSRIQRLQVIRKELYNANIRLDKSPPRVFIRKEIKGGLIVESIVKQELGEETFKSVLREFGYINAKVLIKDMVSLDEFIDALSGNRKYVKSLILINKADSMSDSIKKKLVKELPDALFISAQKSEGIDKLRDSVWNALSFMRIYLKRPGCEPDFDEPLILRGRVTVAEVVRGIHMEPDNLNHAQVWGKSVKFPGQRVGINHRLIDEDVVTLYF